MKKLRKSLSLLLALVLALSFASGAFAASGGEVGTAAKKAAEYVYSSAREPSVGSIGGEWAVIGLARGGADVPQSYFEGYYSAVEDYVRACGGVLSSSKYTEYSRVILALTALGRDPANVAGYDLLAPLGDYDRTLRQGVNGAIWALIALDSAAYTMPQNASAATQATREKYVDAILGRQKADGGWALGSAESSDPDVTAMAACALAGYTSRADVAPALEKAVAALAAMQDSDGGYSSYSEGNSESAAQVIVALCTLGVSPESADFTKNGHSLLDNLLSYQLPGGGFEHVNGGGANQMASEQALCALAAFARSEGGKNALYQMSDTLAGADFGLPGKHTDIRLMPVIAENVDFSDVSASADREAIIALASRGIITGMGDGSFAPDETMTRAQFAAIVVRALGLAERDTGAFSDVPSGEWYAGYVGSANSYGMVNGVGGGLFSPGGTITRQEAATMVARAAKLCGMDMEVSDADTAGVLASFSDGGSVAGWARSSVAFCCRSAILDAADTAFEPLRPILRGEIASMLYNMLDASELI